MTSSDESSSSGSGDPILGARAFGPSRRLRPRNKVLPEYARTHNRSLVLQTLFHGGAMSRADLSRETGLTRVTISDLIAEFLADGIVTEVGVREASGPGKPAILVDIDRSGHQIIGIDLSGTTAFEGAVLSLDGDVLVRRTVPRPDALDAGATYFCALRLIRELTAAATAPVLGVGIGTPGIVSDDGVVVSSPNLAWNGVELEARLASDVGLPVLVRNDANAAVLAEYTFGAGANDTLLIHFGSGVGAASIVSGQPLLGSRSAAGELGHVVVGTDGGPLCVCGKRGCLEAWLRVSALTQLDDPAARTEALRDAGTRLGIALAPVVAVLDPAEVVVAGPPALLAEPLVRAAQDAVRARTYDRVFGDLVVRPSALDDIVLRGAAVMVLAGQLGVS